MICHSRLHHYLSKQDIHDGDVAYVAGAFHIAQQSIALCSIEGLNRLLRDPLPSWYAHVLDGVGLSRSPAPGGNRVIGGRHSRGRLLLILEALDVLLAITTIDIKVIYVYYLCEKRLVLCCKLFWAIMTKSPPAITGEDGAGIHRPLGSEFVTRHDSRLP